MTKEVSNEIITKKDDIKQYLCDLIDDIWIGSQEFEIKLNAATQEVPTIEYHVKKIMVRKG